jgi:hypothetical protein
VKNRFQAFAFKFNSYRYIMLKQITKKARQGAGAGGGGGGAAANSPSTSCSSSASSSSSSSYSSSSEGTAAATLLGLDGHLALDPAPLTPPEHVFNADSRGCRRTDALSYARCGSGGNGSSNNNNIFESSFGAPGGAVAFDFSELDAAMTRQFPVTSQQQQQQWRMKSVSAAAAAAAAATGQTTQTIEPPPMVGLYKLNPFYP